MSEQLDCPHCGSPMRWKFLTHPVCENCMYVEGYGANEDEQTLESAAKQFHTFDDYIAALDFTVTSNQYDLMEATWVAAKSALNESKCALTRSDDAASMQNNATKLVAIRAQEDLPDLKILRDHNDGYLYVWEKVRTQWKMKARFRTWTDIVNSLLEKS